MAAMLAPPSSLGSYNSLDWLLIAAVAVSMIMAFRKGFIRVLFSLMGVVVGFLMASWNYVQFAIWLRQWIVSFAVAEVAAFLVLLAGVTMLFSFAAGFARKGATAVGLGVFDRLLGAGFGLVRGLLAGAGVLTGLVAFTPDSAWVKESALAPYFLAGSHGLSSVVPRQLQEQMAAGRAHLLQQ